jgi:hypothetical protein
MRPATADEIGRVLWERQRAAIRDPEGLNARLAWRSLGAPERFWQGYIDDAEALIAKFDIRVC